MLRLTQRQMVVMHLHKYGSITPLEAMREYGIMRLSAIIYELRKAGTNIVTMSEHSKNRFNVSVTYAKYCLVKDTQGVA